MKKLFVLGLFAAFAGTAPAHAYQSIWDTGTNEHGQRSYEGICSDGRTAFAGSVHDGWYTACSPSYGCYTKQTLALAVRSACGER